MTIGRSCWLSCLSLAVAFLLTGGEASAVERSGYLIGVSLGGGAFGIDSGPSSDSYHSVALDLHTGTSISRNVAIMLDAWGLGSLQEEDEDDSRVVALDTLAVQVWPVERFWIKGGLGVADYVPPGADARYGFGAMAAVGVELIQGGRFVLDLGARAGLASVDDHTQKLFSVNLGFNWY